ncbi:MAG: DUF494 family protein [Calditrichota bacterium]
MDQRLVEILMYVIGELQSRRIRVEEIEGISDELMQQGFSQREVATAISVFADRLGESKRTLVASPMNPHAHRVLHEIERQYVSPEAHGYLIEMTNIGILDFVDIEEIVERCMLMGNLSVGDDEMKMLVASHLLEKDPGRNESSFLASPARPWPERVH